MQLREYQADAIASAYQFLRDRPNENPCIVIPTGGGKTPILATICHDAVTKWNGRVLVLSHVKELIEQTARTLRDWYSDLDIGVYSAGLGSREKHNDIVVAGIQSVYKKGSELSGNRPFDLVLVDECHRIPTGGEGQYQRLLKLLKATNPDTRVIGLTATPYRMKDGYVCSPTHFLNEICYEISVHDLIDQGYLCSLKSKRGREQADLSDVSIQKGEYVASEMESAFNVIVESAVTEVIERSRDYSSVLLFCAGVHHAEMIADRLRERVGESGVEWICGDTEKNERSRIIESFKSGKIKYLCNINVLTEGFDSTRIDMVVLLRATMSPGLYYQMTGRGLRLHKGKDHCLVLDFGGNIESHGPIDIIKVKGKNDTGEAPTKACPECQEIVSIAARECPECGFEFPEPEPDLSPKHSHEATNAAILSRDANPVTWNVTEVTYGVHYKKDWQEGQPRTMRVTYFSGLFRIASEWVCVEHAAYAKNKAFAWWRARSLAEMPGNADEAVLLANLDVLAVPKSIKVKDVPGTKFKEIVSYDFEGVEFEPVDQEWLNGYLTRRREDTWFDGGSEVPF